MRNHDPRGQTFTGITQKKDIIELRRKDNASSEDILDIKKSHVGASSFLKSLDHGKMGPSGMKRPPALLFLVSKYSVFEHSFFCYRNCLQIIEESLRW